MMSYLKSSCLPFSAVVGLGSITGFQIAPKPSLLGGKKPLQQNRKDLFQKACCITEKGPMEHLTLKYAYLL